MAFKKTRSNELEHHQKQEESNDSKLCKLHVKVLCKGAIPDSFIHAQRKVRNGKYTEKDYLDNELLTLYLDQFGEPAFNKSWISVYQRNILLAFAEFIDDPIRCHRGRLAKLHHCKSVLKGLQHKQRLCLFKVVTTLFTATNIETGCIGRYSNKFEKQQDLALYDENGFELLRGMPHYAIRSRFEYLWQTPISKTKYFDCMRMLKASGYFEVEACYLSNVDAQVKKHELREKNASLEEIEAIPRVYSEPAYKMFTAAFFDVFREVINSEFMLESKNRAIGERIKKRLSTIYACYNAFGDAFATRKNKFLSKIKWPQGIKQQEPDPLYH